MNQSGFQRIQSNANDPTAELGTVVTADAATAHTKGAYAELLSSVDYNTYGITILLANTAVSNTDTRFLVDIAIGAAASETIIINNLDGGNAAPLGPNVNNIGGGSMYYFPLHIAAGQRLSARGQGVILADTCNVAIWLHQMPINPVWAGSRVTTYGASTSTSMGVSTPQGSADYGTVAEISASTTNKIKFMQVGSDRAGDGSATANSRGIQRIGIGPNSGAVEWLISKLPHAMSAGLENVAPEFTNMILSNMRFSIPSGVGLYIASWSSGSTENQGRIIYGVD